MSGKLLGGIIGIGVGLALQSAALAFVLGIVGLLIGHRVDAAHELADADLDALLADFEPGLESKPSPPPVETPRALPPPEVSGFIPAACGLFVALGRADGELSRDEIRVAREYFEQTLSYGPRSLQLVRNALKAAIDQDDQLERWVKGCRQALDPKGRVQLLDALYQVALVDGELKRSERDTLKGIARGLSITDEAHRELTRSYFGDGAEAYQTLGLEVDATDDEVKAAFRRLAAESHPDRFAHQGPEAVEAAADRFREVQEAYEALRRLRSF